jgi:hypothetical protein
MIRMRKMKVGGRMLNVNLVSIKSIVEAVEERGMLDTEAGTEFTV